MSRSRARHRSFLVWTCLGAAALAAALGAPLQASDHSDAPVTATGARPDANITDLHAFVVGPNLVLSLATNQAIPPSATSYLFPTDITFDFNIDVDSEVDPDDPEGNGGTILDPQRIQEDVTFRVRFEADGSARLQRIGGNHGAIERRPISRAVRSVAVDSDPAGPVTFAARDTERRRGNDPGVVGFFTGLRDDPFIRGPRQGRNSGAIVIEVPLSSILREQSTILIWATSKIEDADGPFQELTGRSLKSMFPENDALNGLHPRHHLSQAGISPDVIIFDTARPAAYPNGRVLEDDVVDLVGDPRVLGNDAPFPSTNDRSFTSTFPYLATPHPAP